MSKHSALFFLSLIVSGTLTVQAAPAIDGPAEASIEAAQPAVSAASLAVAQAGAALKAAPSPTAFAQFMQALKSMLAQGGMNKAPAAAIIKANPILSELGVKVLDAGSGRIWTFPRIPYTHEVIAQWNDTKATTTFVGRRRRIKRVTYTTVPHIQSLVLPVSVRLRDARVIAGDQGARVLVLVGEEDSNLWLHAFKVQDGGWVDSPDNFSSLPSFLTNNTSGKVTFRGNDLIFNVGRIVPPSGAQTTRLPEAESSTYRFLIKLTDAGYQLQRQTPDLAQFGTVRQFLEAIANNRTDIARSFLADTKLLSIPRYVGVRGPSSTFHVVQMASPPSGAPRYRLVTGQKDDLIFEIAKMKDKPIVRSIFIAPQDPFLQDIAKILPTYDQLVPPPAQPTDTTAAEAKNGRG